MSQERNQVGLCSQSAHDENVLALGQSASRRTLGGRVKKDGRS
jgi:hypothetical protein